MEKNKQRFHVGFEMMKEKTRESMWEKRGCPLLKVRIFYYLGKDPYWIGWGKKILVGRSNVQCSGFFTFSSDVVVDRMWLSVPHLNNYQLTFFLFIVFLFFLKLFERAIVVVVVTCQCIKKENYSRTRVNKKLIIILYVN